MVGISNSKYEATKRRILKIRNSGRLPSGNKKRKKKWNRKAEGTGLYASISEAPSKKNSQGKRNRGNDGASPDFRSDPFRGPSKKRKTWGVPTIFRN
ncbi:hypothetical protein DLM75_18380 [Leptospira stimsonii]|uniref:Uncharacterized protein n=1 Tax=Leptospira stimsonii TaxID=2202203 RepID=A0A396YUQ9_9LEPT|nr:hypothetical protein DLM75_18380 [Leptospira stimsonii]